VPFDLVGIGPGKPVLGRHIADLYAGLTGSMTDQPLSVGSTLSLGVAPTLPAHATPKSYVDAHDPPAGGTTGQVLTKLSNSDYAVAWQTPPPTGLVLPLTTTLTWSPDNTYDLGASSTTLRPRDLWLGRNATIGGTLTLSADPALALQAATKQYVDAGVAGRLTQAQADARYPLKTDPDPYPTYMTQAESDARYQTPAQAAALYLPLAGGTLTGSLLFSADNSRDIGAPGATRPRSVYAATSFIGPGSVPTGGTTGQVLSKSSASDYALSWINDFTQALADARYVQLGGGTMTGLLTLSADPSTNLQAATKQYADTKLTQAQGDARYLLPATAASTYLPLAGGTLTGTLTSRAIAVQATYAITGNGSVPVGGATNQVLSKTSATDYAVAWATPTGGGTASVAVYEAQAVTGSTVTLPGVPASMISVAVNGQELIATRDWTLASNVITFTPALTADDVHVEYMVAPFNYSAYAAHYETTLTVGQSAITLPVAPSGTPLVTRGGVAQYQSAGHYSLAGATLTLGSPIQTGEDGRVSVDYAAGGTFAVADGSITNAKLATDTARANLLTNPGFEIWQRGNGPFTANGAYTVDRWFGNMLGATQYSVVRDTTNQDAASAACAACTVTAYNTESHLSQKIEDATQLRGRTITASMRVRTSTANAVRLSLYNGTTPIYGSYHSGSGSYETLTVTVAVSAAATLVQFNVTFNANCTAYIDNAMLVVGSVPADYAPLHPADDLARCLRYYQRTSAGGIHTFGAGQAFSGTGAIIPIATKAVFTGAPSVTTGTASDWGLSNVTYSVLACTAVAVYQSNASDVVLSCTIASGLTAGNATNLQSVNANAWLAFEANP